MPGDIDGAVVAMAMAMVAVAVGTRNTSREHKRPHPRRTKDTSMTRMRRKSGFVPIRELRAFRLFENRFS